MTKKTDTSACTKNTGGDR